MRCRILSLALALALSSLLTSCRDGPSAGVPKPGLDGPFEVTKVVDGDTIHVGTPPGIRKVRFLCIDTPEVRGQNRSPLGKSATSALRELLGGAHVYLAAAQDHDDADRYGRLLRHVFLQDETHLNLELVRGLERLLHEAWRVPRLPRALSRCRGGGAHCRRRDLVAPRFPRRRLPGQRPRRRALA